MANASGELAAGAIPASSAAAALTSGMQWSGAAGSTVVTYSFATRAVAYTADADFASTLMPFSEADKALTRALLGTISDVCNVTFVEVADSAASQGQVRYAYSQMPNMLGYAGFAFFPGTPGSGGNVWLGKTMAAAQWDWYRPSLLLHETLHAMGLKHPFDGAITLDAQSDLISNTVMSYSAIAGSRTGSLSAYPAAPMALDIVALQSLYGEAEHNAGDTIYDLASARFQSSFHAIWDSGGFDTLDASALRQGVTLDLRGGGRSNIGVTVDATGYFGTGAARTVQTSTYTDTVALAAGTTIEAAVATPFDDVIRAGPATRLIDGGDGMDTAVFFGSVDDHRIDLAPGGYVITHLQTGFVTHTKAIERVEFSDARLQNAAMVERTGDLPYEQAYRLYQAALDRAPDQAGLIYHTRAIESGLSLTQVAANFMASPEFKQRYDVNTSGEFVTLLYANVLDRAPDAAGLSYHVASIEAGGASWADVLVGFSESAENQQRVAAEMVGASAGMLVPL